MVKLLKAGTIADPVHRSIIFTMIERELVDHYATQRLRNVSQTGLGHLVYPELRSSRFTHCLGAMHLSSLFLASCLRNSEPEAVAMLLEGIMHAVDQHFTRHSQFATPATLSEIDDRLLGLQAHVWCPVDIHASHDRSGDSLDEDDPALQPRRVRRAVAIVEQALRLTSLFHDLGHLPFSHDFEFALDELLRSELQDPVAARIKDLFASLQSIEADRFHEVIGPELAHLILRDVLARHDGSPEGDFFMAMFDLALDIWSADDPYVLARDPDTEKTKRAAVLSFLKSIVSGQLDVDRCDYILRDGRNYGFDFASFNLSHLLGELIAVEKDSTLVLSVRSKGISSLDTFVQSRYRSYQFGVLHHKTSQVAAALQYAIRDTISESELRGRKRGEEVTQFVDDLKWLIQYGARRDRHKGALTTGPNSEQDRLRRFATYDDYWFIELMRANCRPESSDPWMNLVLYRSPGPRSLWKRIDDFEFVLRSAHAGVGRSDDCDLEFSSTIPVTVREWNKRLPDLKSRLPESENLDSPATLWQNAVKSLRDGHNVLVLNKGVKAFKLDARNECIGFDVLASSGEVLPLTSISPLARSLRDAWKEDLQVQAFVRDSPPSDEENLRIAAFVVHVLWAAMSTEGETS